MPISWKDKIESLLYGPNAARVVTTATIIRLARSDKPDLSENTIHLWLGKMTETGKLLLVRRGLYANMRTHPEVLPQEAAQHIRAGAVVSLHSVLGECGFLNNPSRIVFAVVPIPDKGNPGSAIQSVNVGAIKTGIGMFRFHALPASFTDSRAGSLADREQQSKLYRKATPEKALLDWLHLAESPRSKLSMPPLDVDFSEMNIKRLHRLAAKMKLGDALRNYIERVERYNEDPDVQVNASNALGF